MSRPPRFDRKGVDPIPERPTPFKWVWIKAVQAHDSGLSATETHVAVALGLFADDDGHRVFPGASTLASRTKLNVKTVERIRLKLANDGWLFLVEQGGLRGAVKSSNEYSLTLPVHVDNPRLEGLTPPAQDGGLSTTPRSGRGAPPADDGSTPRSGRDEVITKEPAEQPRADAPAPPTHGGGSKLQPEVVRLGSAHASAIRAALDAGRAAS